MKKQDYVNVQINLLKDKIMNACQDRIYVDKMEFCLIKNVLEFNFSQIANKIKSIVERRKSVFVKSKITNSSPLMASKYVHLVVWNPMNLVFQNLNAFVHLIIFRMVINALNVMEVQFGINRQSRASVNFHLIKLKKQDNVSYVRNQLPNLINKHSLVSAKVVS